MQLRFKDPMPNKYRKPGKEVVLSFLILRYSLHQDCNCNQPWRGGSGLTHQTSLPLTFPMFKTASQQQFIITTCFVHVITK
eukprot:2929348-Amphidinium_carterae.1